MKEERNPIEALLNPEDEGTIVLYDENDNPVSFEQIALIPMDDSIYAILKPVEKMEGVNDDEAIVFELSEDEETGSELLNVVDEEEVINKVFDIYYQLLDEDGCDCEDCKDHCECDEHCDCGHHHGDKK